MPKIRALKPDTWTDDKFVRLSPLARLLFMGMWTLACDNGHVEDNHVQLKIRLLPMDDCKVADLLDEMVATGQVEQHDGYLKVTKLAEHQKPDLRFLALCEWCEHDVHTTYTPDDKRPRSKGARRAPDERTPSARGVHVDDVDGDVDSDGDVDRKPARKRATQLPDDWSPNERHRDMATQDMLDLDREAQQFKDHALANGKTYKDWDAAFRTWLTNSVKWGRGGNVRPLTPSRQMLHARDVELPPDGLSPEEYAAWEREQRAKRASQ